MSESAARARWGGGTVAALARHARPNPYRADSLAPDTAGESA